MDRVATKVGEVGCGRMQVFLGAYSSYRDRRIAAGSTATPSAPPPSPESATPDTRVPGATPSTERPDRLDRAERQARADAERRRRRGPAAQERELAKVETEIGRVTARKAEVEAMLADPAHYGEPGALETLAAEHATFAARIAGLEARWETLAAEIEALSA
jgi:hypothetical protein